MLHVTTRSGNRQRPMFSILRFFLIVGVIFYYSPVRQKGEGTSAIEAFLSPKEEQAASALEAGPGHLETVWQALPDGAKQAVVDKILTTSGLGSNSASKATDTLQPTDRQPAWRGDGSKPRT